MFHLVIYIYLHNTVFYVNLCIKCRNNMSHALVPLSMWLEQRVEKLVQHNSRQEDLLIPLEEVPLLVSLSLREIHS